MMFVTQDMVLVVIALMCCGFDSAACACRSD